MTFANPAGNAAASPGYVRALLDRVLSAASLAT